MDLFTASDFKIFDLPGFNERMGSITLQIRPKLDSIGKALAPKLSPLVDRPLFVHVAKHARRTVNPPNDTWAALGGDRRGYKKDVHFKVAVSRHCVRFLFEAGPEYYAKADWAKMWSQEFAEFARALRSGKDLCWFRNEHDEEPAAAVRELETDDFRKLGDELTRRRDGQIVFGSRIHATEFVRMKPADVERAALTTFKPLAPLFHLNAARRDAS